jgi:hypothetical protein
MLALLPVAAFALTLFAFRQRSEDRSWREGFLAAAILLGASTVLATEVMSLVHVVGRPAVAVYWSIVCVFAAGFFVVSRRQGPSPTSVERGKLTTPDLVLLGGIAAYVVATGVIALVAPPNTWDAMEYHLPKVMHWMQNGSVSFYPTAIPRQNHLAPGAEFFVLHLHLLWGSDRLTNLVEWFAMVGSLCAVSLIARQLGARMLGQCVAAVFAVTLPMGIMQASSAQTDTVVAFWFVCAVHFLLRLVRADTARWPVVVGFAASLGLAAFTKATVYLFAPGFLLWLALALLRRHRWRAIPPFAAITAVFLLLNASHYARNWQVYGHPLGPREEPTPNSRYALESHAPNALLSSLSKHVGTHINSPWRSLNGAIQRGYQSFHQSIGWELNDPRTSFGPAFARFRIGLTDFQDETAGNPLHFLLGAIGVALVLLVPVLRRDRTLLVYALAVAAAFLLFAFFLKWHPWMSRLHQGIFIAAAPLVAAVLTRPRRAIVAAATGVALLVLGVPWLLWCQERPMFGAGNIFNTPREALYFRTPHQRYHAAFTAMRDFLADQQIDQVGLVTTNSSWEYMAWLLLRENHPAVRFEHVNIVDPSVSLADHPPFRDFSPDTVLVFDQRTPPEQLTVGPTTFTRRWVQDAVAVYRRD